MVAVNKLQQSPPYPVERAMKRLGQNLRIARLRRNMTVLEVAERIGTGRRAVLDAEKGKSSTGLVMYAGLLWLYDQLSQLEDVADPSKDKEGLSLEIVKGRQRTRKSKGLSRDF